MFCGRTNLTLLYFSTYSSHSVLYSHKCIRICYIEIVHQQNEGGSRIRTLYLVLYSINHWYVYKRALLFICSNRTKES